VIGSDRDPRGRPTTVIHLITTLTQGGAEHVLSQIVPRPEDHPEERHIVVSLVPGGMFAEALTADGVEVRDLGMRPGRDLVRGVLRLSRMLRATGPHTVVSWLSHASLLDLLARPLGGAGRRARMVWMVRGSLDAMATMPRHTRLTLRFLVRRSKRPDLIVTNSIAGRDQYAGVGFRPRQWLHLPNPCDTRRFAPDLRSGAAMRDELGVDADALLVLFVGRNHPEKGFDLLLDALPRLAGHRAASAMVVVLVGEGTERAEPRAGTPCRVLALGARQDVAALLRAADALVLPSRSEGTPNAVLEAMASGVACVVTDVGDSAAVVGSTGIVIPVATVAAVAAGLEAVITMERAALRALGAAARERVVAHHGADDSRSRYRALWTEVAR